MNGKTLGFAPSRQFRIGGDDQGNTEAQPTHLPEFGQGTNLLSTPGSAPVGMDHKRALFSLDAQNSTSAHLDHFRRAIFRNYTVASMLNVERGGRGSRETHDQKKSDPFDRPFTSSMH